MQNKTSFTLDKKNQSDLVINLLPKIQSGDLQAFEQLYNLYKVQVFNFCFSILKSNADAQEVVQDIFLKVWQFRNQYNEITSFNGFLYRIAKNLTLNKIRKKAGQPEKFDSLQDDFSIINQTENEVLFEETKEILDTAIEALPPKRQEIFRLSREEGLSNEEIAKKLDISINTVKGQMRKALAFLKSYLEWISVLCITWLP